MAVRFAKSVVYLILRTFRRFRLLEIKKGPATYEELGHFDVIVQGDKYLWVEGKKFDCLLRNQMIGHGFNGLSNVLDFGGGGGRHGFELIKRGLVKHWSVVELPQFIETAREVLDIPQISFLERIPGREDSFDIGHASNSLQYTECPLAYLEELVAVTSEWLFLEKLVVTSREKSMKFRQVALVSEHSPEGFKLVQPTDSFVSYQVSCPPISDVEHVISKKFKIVQRLTHGPQLHVPLGKGLFMIDLVAERH